MKPILRRKIDDILDRAVATNIGLGALDCISGRVFWDIDGDKAIDGAEIGLSGLTITLTGDNVSQTTTTTIIYTWDFGDMTPDIQATTTLAHTYTSSGYYTTTVIARDQVSVMTATTGVYVYERDFRQVIYLPLVLR